MAKIIVNKDYTNLENGDYTGTVNRAVLCKSEKVMLKIEMEDGTFFVTFHTLNDIGRYPFNQLFMAVDSDNLEDIEGLKIQFRVENNKSKENDIMFSNIRKIKVLE